MFCSKCGCSNADTNTFCQKCGAPLKANNSQNNVYAGNSQPFKPTAPIIKAPIVRSTHPVLNALKTLGSSPVFLVATIAYSVYLLFSLVNTVSGYGGIMGYMDVVLDELDVPSYLFYDVINAIEDITILSAIISMIPAILICVGLWLTFASAVNRQNQGMSTSGLTIIKVVSVINLVINCIILAIVEVFLLIAIANSSRGYFSRSGLTETLLTVALVVGGIGALYITYLAKIVTTINTIKNTIITGTANDRISGFVGVMCFITGGFSVFSLFTLGGFYSMLSGLANTTALITFGVIIFMYKNVMRTLIGPVQKAPQYVQPCPVYQQAPYKAPSINEYSQVSPDYTQQSFDEYQQNEYTQQNDYQQPDQYTQQDDMYQPQYDYQVPQDYSQQDTDIYR